MFCPLCLGGVPKGLSPTNVDFKNKTDTQHTQTPRACHRLFRGRRAPRPVWSVAHVTGWEPYHLHGARTHVSWVGSALVYRPCTASHSGKLRRIVICPACENVPPCSPPPSPMLSASPRPRSPSLSSLVPRHPLLGMRGSMDMHEIEFISPIECTPRPLPHLFSPQDLSQVNLRICPTLFRKIRAFLLNIRTQKVLVYRGRAVACVYLCLTRLW